MYDPDVKTGFSCFTILLFFFFFKTTIASSVITGAEITSMNNPFNISASSTFMPELNATIPPKAETGSHLNAFWYASRELAAVAAPAGLLCFTIAQLSGPKSSTISTAEIRSRILL